MNTHPLTYIEAQYLAWKGIAPKKIESIAQAGSSRSYFRLWNEDGSTCIATFNGENIEENQVFVYFTKQFGGKGLPVPEILHISPAKDLYFQSDVGDISLFETLTQEKYTENVYSLYQSALIQLAHIQIEGHEVIDYRYCLTSPQFDKQAILYDLHYFLFYFVNAVGVPYDRNQLLNDFELFAAFLTQEQQQYFMFRDFQSRNIMVKDKKVYFIDYQGGMQGALQYDVVSLLWQAKAALPSEWKKSLLDTYFAEANRLLQGKLDAGNFYENYKGYILVRILQTFGSYGFRGLFERRPYFLSAIPAALTQLQTFLSEEGLPVRLPALSAVLHALCSPEVRAKFTANQANADSKLIVKINSFSYKKGIPADTSSNGGGFVFDCRSLHNPGRYAPYVDLTGRDTSVKQFLLTQSLMPQFLQHVYSLTDIAVQNYLERGFDSLMISFGCTGGKHRSVFAADTLAQHLKSKFNVKIELQHIERGWEKEIL